MLIKCGFSLQNFEKVSNIMFHQNPSSGSRVFQCGQTDIWKVIVAFRNFANAQRIVHNVIITEMQNIYGCSVTLLDREGLVVRRTGLGLLQQDVLCFVVVIRVAFFILFCVFCYICVLVLAL
jgi:hypothetical protein